MQQSHNKKVVTTIIILIVTALLVGGGVVIAQKNKANMAGASSDNTHKKAPAVTVAKPKSPSTSSIYKDGTYQATGDYESPGGSQELKLSITLQNSIITDTSAEGDHHADDSQIYQANFIAAYKQKIVGKNISDVKLSQIAGSSLTPIGFNNALDDIKNQAKS